MSEIEAKSVWRVRLVCLAAILALFLSLLARYRLLEVPLERDEGEYAYAGWLLTQGVPPYAQAFNMKNPGIYYAYAGIIKLLGPSLGAVHLGLLAVHLASLIFVYLTGAKLFGRASGLCAAAMFALLSVLPKIQGAFANSEHFVLLPVLAGLWLFLNYLDSRKTGWLLGAGFSFGLGFLVKQHGALFGVFAGLWLLGLAWPDWRNGFGRVLRDFCLFVAACALPFALSCLYLYQAGVLKEFYFWTVNYASQYVSLTPLWLGASRFVSRPWGLALDSGFLAWGLGLAGYAALWRKGLKRELRFLAGLGFFALLSIMPGLHLRWHYYLLLLPGLVFTAGYAALNLGRGRLAALVCAAAFLLPLGLNADFLFKADMAEASRQVYPENPFPETLELGRNLEKLAGPEDLVGIVGSEPQINFYAQRRSGSGYIYMYPLLEEQNFAKQMREDFMAGLAKEKPRYLVYVNVRKSWDYLPEMNQDIFAWLAKLWREDYELIGYQDLGGPARYAPAGGGIDFALKDSFGYLPIEELKVIARPEADTLPSSDAFIILLRRKG